MKFNKQNTNRLTTTIDAFNQRYYLLALTYAEQVKFVLETDMAPILVNGVPLQVYICVRETSIE